MYCPGNDGRRREDPMANEDSLPSYIQVDRTDTLVRCNICGAVVEGDVVGQVIHNIWHENESGRIRSVIHECGL